jgi:hypothetical protein
MYITLRDREFNPLDLFSTTTRFRLKYRAVQNNSPVTTDTNIINMS